MYSYLTHHLPNKLQPRLYSFRHRNNDVILQRFRVPMYSFDLQTGLIKQYKPFLFRSLNSRHDTHHHEIQLSLLSMNALIRKNHFIYENDRMLIHGIHE